MYGINLQAVADSDYPIIVKATARRLQETDGYLNIGTYLGSLSKLDLNELVSYCNAITLKVEKPIMLDSIVLLADMLAQAEGMSLEPDIQRVANLIILINFENLARKGIINFYRENATLGKELNGLLIAELK